MSDSHRPPLHAHRRLASPRRPVTCTLMRVVSSFGQQASDSRRASLRRTGVACSAEPDFPSAASSSTPRLCTSASPLPGTAAPRKQSMRPPFRTWQRARARDRLAMVGTALESARKSNRGLMPALLLNMRKKRGLTRMPVAAVVPQCQIRHVRVQRSSWRVRCGGLLTSTCGARDGHCLLLNDDGVC